MTNLIMLPHIHYVFVLKMILSIYASLGVGLYHSVVEQEIEFHAFYGAGVRKITQTLI